MRPRHTPDRSALPDRRGASPKSTLRRATLLLTLTLGIAACGADARPTLDTADPAPAPGVDVGSGLLLPDPTEGLARTGWLDTADPFRGLPLADTPVTDWPELLDELAASAAAGLPVTTVTERDPDACTLWRSIVTDVRFGDGPAAERMRATTLATLRSLDHDPGPLLGAGEEPWCGDRPREALAFYATLVLPAYCALPDTAEVRCITITTFRYDGGAHPNTVRTDLLFETSSGDRLDVERLLGRLGLDPERTRAFVESTVCDLDVADGLLAAGDDCWPVRLRNAIPTPAGLVLSFSPYESGPYAFGPRDLFVPWDELRSGAEVPETVRAANRALRQASGSEDWSLVSALLPPDGDFLVADGRRTTDPIGLLRTLPRDPRPEWEVVLRQRPGRIDSTTVWPELAVRDPFVISDEERSDLDAAFGIATIDAWIAAGRYLGWRAGFADDGTWRFIVAGD